MTFSFPTVITLFFTQGIAFLVMFGRLSQLRHSCARENFAEGQQNTIEKNNEYMSPIPHINCDNYKEKIVM